MAPLTSVLIVDDEPAVRDLMSRWVASLGLRPQTASTAEEALASLRLRHYDLAVIDVMMPGHDGLWLAGEIQREHPHTAVIVATAYTELLDKDAQQAPLADILIKPFQRERFALAVDRGRQWRKQALEELHWHALLSIELRDHAARIRHALDGRVAAGATEADALHSKPSPLTPGEMAIMRQHVEIGAEILESTHSLAVAAPGVRASHEWFGGGGYPRKAAGITIPFVGRLIAVADAYDAMTQDRAYRIRFNSSDAVAEILRCSPAQFDPEIVDAFLAVLGRH